MVNGIPAVKICGLTRPEDARAAAGAGVQAVGLVFAPSPRRVTIRQARRIIAVLPVHIVRVGVFVDESMERVEEIAAALGLDRLQFCGAETQSGLRRFPQARIIQALRPKPGAPLPKRDPAPMAAALLVDAFVQGLAGGTGLTSNWAYAKGLHRFGKPVILSGGLNAENVREAIRQVHPDMVDVSSGVEVRPGIKSTVKIRQFVQVVRATTESRASRC